MKNVDDVNLIIWKNGVLVKYFFLKQLRYSRN